MAALLILAAAAVFLLLILRAADWLAREWFAVVLVLSLLSYVALYFWHRRALARIQSAQADALGRYRRHNKFTSWPRWCRDCGITVHEWRQLSAHERFHEPAHSPDEPLPDHELPRGPQDDEEAPRVLRVASVSTVIRSGDDGPEAAAEEVPADVPMAQLQARAEQRAATWARIDGVIGRITGRQDNE